MKFVERVIEVEQWRRCHEHKSAFTLVTGEEKIGFAISTLDRMPINGLRHLPADGTTGWYIWCGAEMSTASDFFKPFCVKHLVERIPQAADFLGLARGYRFL